MKNVETGNQGPTFGPKKETKEQGLNVMRKLQEDATKKTIDAPDKDGDPPLNNEKLLDTDWK